MTNITKEWLVRTQGGNILGPFSEKELLEELKKKTFSPQDEIARSMSNWCTAQSLTYRDTDELTRTYTKNISGTTQTTEEIRPFNSSEPTTVSITETPVTQTPIPTPSLRSQPAKQSLPVSTRKNVSSNQVKLLLIFVFGFTAFWLLISRSRTGSFNDNLGVSAGGKNTLAELLDSPFVKHIYELIETGETQIALRELAQYHERPTNKDDLTYLIPYSLLLVTESDQQELAKSLLKRVLSSSSSDELKAQAHHWLGYAELALGEGDVGEAHFLESLHLNPKNAASCFNLGYTYLRQKKYPQALDYLRLAELIEPNLWLIHIYKGRAKFLLGRVSEAQASFQRAIEVSADRWFSYLYYAVFLDATKKNDEAKKIIRQMLTRDPDYEQNTPGPLGFFKEKTSLREYLETYDQVMRTVPAEERELGRLYLNYLMGENGLAEGERIEQLGEHSEFGKVITLKVALDRDGPSGLIRKRLTAIAEHPREFGYYAHVLRAEAKLRLGQLDEAKKALETSLILEPQAAVAHWSYAMLLKKLNLEQPAHDELQTLLSLHPKYLPALITTSHTRETRRILE